MDALLKAAFYFFSSNCNDPITIKKISGPWTRQVPPRVGRPVYGQVRCGLDGQAGSLARVEGCGQQHSKNLEGTFTYTFQPSFGMSSLQLLR